MSKLLTDIPAKRSQDIFAYSFQNILSILFILRKKIASKQGKPLLQIKSERMKQKRKKDVLKDSFSKIRTLTLHGKTDGQREV